MARPQRLLWTFAAIAGLTMAGLTAGLPSAGAATEGGQILTKVAGSAYSPETLMYGVAKGTKPAVYSYEIRNTGTVQTQYLLGMVVQNGNGIWHIMDGKTQITEPKFYTPPVAPGAAYAFTVEAAVPAGGLTPGANNATIDFFVPGSGLYLGTTAMYLFQDTKFTGSSNEDFFTKSGSQGWVSGTGATESAAAAHGKSGQFIVRIQNDTSSSNVMRLILGQGVEGAGCAPSDFTAVVKLGSRDVSSALSFAGGGLDLTLAAGAHVTMKESVSFTGADAGCAGWFGFLSDELSGSVQHSQTLMPVAAS